MYLEVALVARVQNKKENIFMIFTTDDYNKLVEFTNHLQHTRKLPSLFLDILPDGATLPYVTAYNGKQVLTEEELLELLHTNKNSLVNVLNSISSKGSPFLKETLKSEFPYLRSHDGAVIRYGLSPNGIEIIKFLLKMKNWNE